MAKKSGPKFDLEAVRGITEGPEAKARKRHNKQRPGEIFEGKTAPPERDRLDRENLKAAKREQQRANLSYEGKPRPGEQFSAKSKKDPEEVEKERVKGFLTLAMKRWRLCAEAESENRKDALDDLKFLTGEQWTPDIKNQRELDGRPCLTMNRLPQFVRQVTNEQRQQRPSVQVNPVGDGADTDTAEILQGMVRHIEVNSDAEIAYDTAFETMVGSGWKGYIRICSDYVSDESDEQELQIKRVKNAFNVYSDPAAVEPDECDARFKFVVEDIPIDEYKQQYGGTDAASLTDFSSIGDDAPEWATKDSIRVAEYWYVTTSDKKKAYLEDGSLVDSEAVPEGAKVQNWRNYVSKTVRCAKINAIEIIDEWDWPGSSIPLVPVIGDDYEVDGKRKLSGLVRHAKDAQRSRNFFVSAAAEMIALAPRSPYLAPEGSIENHETEWRDANRRNLAVLTHKVYDAEGRQLPVPQRVQFDPQIATLFQLTAISENDLKATTGIYDASLGEKGPDESGKAILARQKQSDVSTLNYSDNLARSLKAVGKILIEVIPHFYDTPRVQRIIKPDQTHSQVGIFNSQNLPNGMNAQSVQDLPDMQAVKKIYDIGVGRYDVTVNVGPNYQTKRQEAQATMLEFIRVFPQSAPIVGDLVAQNSDWPGAKEIAKRLKMMLPPQLQGEEAGDPAFQAQQMQQHLMQAMAQHDQLVQVVNNQQKIIDAKQVEAQSREKIAAIQAMSDENKTKMQEATKLAVAQLNASKDANQSYADREIEQYQIMSGQAHDVALERMQHVNALQQGQQQAQQAQQAAAQQAQLTQNQPQAGAPQ